MIIDAHTHIGEAGGRDWGPSDLAASMQDAHVDFSLLISADVTNAPLEKVLEASRQNPRIKAIGHINYKTFGEEQIDKLIGHLEKKEIHGIKLYPGYENYYPYDKSFGKIFSYCEKNNHPIIIHSGVLLSGSKGYLEQAHPLHADRIAHEYPHLNIVIAHMGYPWFQDTMAVMWKNPNVYADLSAFFTEFTPIAEEETKFILRKLEDVRGMIGNFDRFLFGTDWPLYPQKDYLSFIELLGLEGEEKELVMWKNADRIFHITRT